MENKKFLIKTNDYYGFDSRWYVISDDVIEEVSFSSVMESPAYLLFYERQYKLEKASLKGL